MIIRIILALALAVIASGCEIKKVGTSTILVPTIIEGGEPPSPVIRQPVLPEMLVTCRGHVLVPALGMIFVPKGQAEPSTGQYLREENVSPPYRIISPGARISQEHSVQRLNVELDRYRRVIGLYCG